MKKLIALFLCLCLMAGIVPVVAENTAVTHEITSASYPLYVGTSNFGDVSLCFLDGANDMVIFLRIILPLSMPVVATIALFNGVWQWNDYFTGVMYINDADLQPIQTFLYRIIASASASKAVVSLPAGISAQQVSSQSVRLATMVVTTLPIVCDYPFLQKYFVKGMLIGSIKG